MKTIDLNSPAALYLGTSRANARAQGQRHFTAGYAAIRFAMEQAAPVSLRGALLQVGDRWLSGDDIRALYAADRRFARQPVRELEQNEIAA